MRRIWPGPSREDQGGRALTAGNGGLGNPQVLSTCATPGLTLQQTYTTEIQLNLQYSKTYST